MLDYTLKRSKRKSVGLRITDSGEVVVTAPIHAKKSIVDEVVTAKSSWIKSKLQIIKNRQESFTPKNYTDGENFEYLGASYPLTVLNNNNQICLSDHIISVGIKKATNQSASQQELIKKKVINWYRKQAQFYLDNIGFELAAEIGVNPVLIKEKAFLSSWGMCHSNGKIYINFKLIMAPKEVLNYVIIHELCHLVHPNHSKEFWSLVEQHCDNFKVHRNWLKDNGYKLQL